MKLPPRDSANFFTNPDLSKTGVLIFGNDAMRVALRRQALIKQIIGPDGDSEMRLTRISGADLRKDVTLAVDALKSVSFFSGNRVVWVEDANENCAAGVLAAIEGWAKGDAFLVVTGGNMTPKSKIRKGFEAHKNAYAIAIYNDPPSREEIEQNLKKAGISDMSADAHAAIEGYAKILDPGDFAQFVEKLSLYTLENTIPVALEDIAAVAPQSIEAQLDDVLNIVADLRTDQLSPVLHRLAAQGVTPTALCIGAMRHFKTLHVVASDTGGAAAGIGKIFPPLYGPRRAVVQRQAQNWGRVKLEKAISMLLEADLALRSAGQTAPQMAVVERCFIRIAMMGKMAA